MNAMAYLRARFPQFLRLSWLVLALVLAACNSGGNNTGGGVPGY